MTGRLIFAFAALGSLMVLKRGAPDRPVPDRVRARRRRPGRDHDRPAVLADRVGSDRIDSGIAAIETRRCRSSSRSLRSGTRRASASGWRVGIVLGIVGVGVSSEWTSRAAGRALSARWRSSLRPLYAVGTLYSQHKLGNSSGLLVGTASTFWGLLAILPLGIAQRPDATPGWADCGCGCAGAPRDRHRPAPVPVSARAAWLGEGEPRRLPAARDRALRRRGLPRRADPPDGDRRAGADPGRRCARVGVLRPMRRRQAVPAPTP